MRLGRDEVHRGGAAAAAGAAPNIGRGSTGCGVGIDALASPIAAHAIMPPLIDGVRADAEEGRVPQHQVGELADLDRADLVVERRARSPGRSCTSRRSGGPGCCRPHRRPRRAPRRFFITCAVCQVRSTTSPMRPIACASLPIIEIAPMSCSRSSAAIVDGRIRLSAKARSSGTLGFRWWHTISMSRCSSRVLTVCGRVGLVELGSTFGLRGHRDDVGCVPAAGTLGVIGVDAAAVDRGQGVLDEARLVEGVGVQVDLYARRVGDRQAGVDRGGRRAPVLVQLESRCAAAQLLPHGVRVDGVALAEQQRRSAASGRAPRACGPGARTRASRWWPCCPRRPGAAARRSW